MRTPAKVQSLRAHEIDGGDKTGGSQTHLARAVALHLAGKREEALKQLQRAIAANEASAEIYRAMGHIQFELGDFDEAGQELPHAGAAEAAVRHGLVQPGGVPGACGRVGRGRAGLPRACTLDATPPGRAPRAGRLPSAPGRPEVRAVLLRALPGAERPDTRTRSSARRWRCNRWAHPDEASEIYQKILERNPESEESLSNLILIGMAKEDFEMVREYSERLLELRPESTVALEGLAAWASRRRRPRADGQVLHAAGDRRARATSRAGSTWRWRTRNRGAAKQAAEAYEEALKLRAAILRGPHQPGHRARATGRPAAGARAAYERAMQADPEALAPLWNLALLLEHSGQFEEAETLLQAGAGEARPRKRKRASAWATCGLQREDYRGAAEAFEGCLKYRPALAGSARQPGPGLQRPG